MAPRVSVLIATMGRRNDKFLSLLSDLTPQLENRPVEVVAYWNNGELPIGEIRQALLKEAKGDYVCFVDDDDSVPDYYIPEILKAIETNPDYVGFQVELFERLGDEETKMPPVYHSIRYGVWHQDDNGYYRGITHLNPIKRKLAIKGKFSNEGAGEDESWARTMMPLARTEVYIDKIMYYYHHDPDDSAFASRHPQHSYIRPDFNHLQFRWHPDSKTKTEEI